MRIKGIRRYPQTVKSVSPTKHMYGAEVTWSAHTDTFRPVVEGHGTDAEINAFKYNLHLTMLLNPQTDGVHSDKIKDALETGRMDAGIYFRAKEALQSQIEFFERLTGKSASYWSYANGIRDYDNFVMENSLVSRNSAGGSVDYDFDTRLGQRVATAFNYDVRDNDMSHALSNAENILSQAITDSGWFNDFSHWHWAEFYGDKNQLEQFFASQRTILNTVNSISLGSGEAVEYMWIRKQFKRGGLYQDGNDLVLICDVWNENELPYKAIDTTLSVEVDLIDTNLEGKDITSNTDILKISNNKFIVQVPYSNRDGFRTVKLKETTTPNYIDLSTPTIISTTNSGSVINITTDKPTNAVLFSVPIGGELYLAEVENRSNSMSEDHEFIINNTGRDYYVGVITKEKQSILSGKL